MMREMVKWMVFKCIYPFWYWLASRKPVDSNKVIFVENHQAQLTDNYKLLYEQLQQRGYTIHVHYLRVAHSGWGKIIKRSLILIRDLGDASVIFLNESNSLFGSFTLREQTQMVQVWHACGAFKKWGCSVADKEFGDDAKALARYSGHRNYTLVPVSGREVCGAYEEAFGISGRGIVRPLGVSRTDVFFDETYRQQAQKKLAEWRPEWKGRKLILYLPTFRGSINQAKAPDAMDWKQLAALDDSYIVVVLNHPFVTKRMEIPKELQERFFDLSGADVPLTTNEWMMVSDICITDYSSVLFEYSLLGRPILFFAYDLESYYNERGFYYPYESFVPGPIVKNTGELVHVIENIDTFDYAKLQAFRERYMSGCDGACTRRILHAIYGEID